MERREFLWSTLGSAVGASVLGTVSAASARSANKEKIRVVKGVLVGSTANEVVWEFPAIDLTPLLYDRGTRIHIFHDGRVFAKIAGWLKSRSSKFNTGAKLQFEYLDSTHQDENLGETHLWSFDISHDRHTGEKRFDMTTYDLNYPQYGSGFSRFTDGNHRASLEVFVDRIE